MFSEYSFTVTDMENGQIYKNRTLYPYPFTEFTVNCDLMPAQKYDFNEHKYELVVNPYIPKAVSRCFFSLSPRLICPVTPSSLIGHMLQRDPKKRATLEQIEGHQWLQGVDPSPATKLSTPLVSHRSLSEEEHGSIIQRMVLGCIADRDAITEYVSPPYTNTQTDTYITKLLSFPAWISVVSSLIAISNQVSVISELLNVNVEFNHHLFLLDHGSLMLNYRRCWYVCVIQTDLDDPCLRALESNQYNHITATYFLLAERMLRERQEKEQHSQTRSPSPSKAQFRYTRSPTHHTHTQTFYRDRQIAASAILHIVSLRKISLTGDGQAEPFCWAGDQGQTERLQISNTVRDVLLKISWNIQENSLNCISTEETSQIPGDEVLI